MPLILRATSTLMMALVATLVACASTPTPDAQLPSTLAEFDREEILTRRARWNSAFARREIDEHRSLVTEDFTLAIGPGIFAGKDDAMSTITSLFESRPDIRFVRHPLTVRGHAGWPIAYEYGWWEEQWTEAGQPTDLRGSYMVMWRKTPAGWLQQAEIFVPSSCTGSSYCRPR